MSPRSSSAAAPPAQTTRTSSTPYARRSASQPKSSRQQFSACGACRMRRVRCDLKDLPIGFVGPHPACSNCKERGIKCVDEFADVKAVKLLRRGRRLQQVEAIFGKVDEEGASTLSTGLSAKPSTTIPTLHSDFFLSPFWRWFTIQRPILDAGDFPARFAAHCKGSQSLSDEAGLISMLLVAWAASFGLNERGLTETESSPKTPSDHTLSDGPSAQFAHPGNRRRQWKNTTEILIREILELIDLHGILRRPTLDGVRVLLLLLPLLEEAQPLERLVIYEATLSQVQALCIVSAGTSSGFEDAAVRSRIFWYAYTQEGILTGMRGGRFVLDNEDLDTFQRSLPASHDMGRSGLPSPDSPSSDLAPSNIGPYRVQDSANYSAQESASHKAFIHLMHATSVPLDLSNICRMIHVVVTGIKATRRAENHGLIDAQGMREIWRGLDRCWQELESMKRSPLERENILRRLEINQYVSSWQIFIFECHNVIRESLKHFSSNSSSQAIFHPSSPSRPSSHSSSSSPYLSPQHLHAVATRRCLTLLPRIIHILRIHLPSENNDIPGIFKWDAGLVRDGCFFAAYLAANLEGEFIDGEDDNQDSVDSHLTVDDGVSVCLKVLAIMRWGFSKSEEREDTIKMVWESRKLRRQGQAQHIPLYDADYTQSLSLSSNIHISPHIGLAGSSSVDRPMLPPLNMFISQRRPESAPSATTCSTDDRGWPSYTPPDTATSVATSTGTGLSRRGSPVFSHMTSFKSPDDMFYHGGEMDQFNYNVPITTPIIRENPGLASSYRHRNSPMEAQALAATTAANYMVTATFNVSNSSILTHADFHSCSQFGENCNGSYH